MLEYLKLRTGAESVFLTVETEHCCYDGARLIAVDQIGIAIDCQEDVHFIPWNTIFLIAIER